MRPEKIEQISKDVLAVSWDDGTNQVLYTSTLRRNCPCAICSKERGDSNPLKVLPYDPDNLEIESWDWVGRYAISLKWGDGHDTGIYTYSYLRELGESQAPI